MISIKKARLIEEDLNDLSDEEVLVIISEINGICQLAYESWLILDSNNPERLLQDH